VTALSPTQTPDGQAVQLTRENGAAVWEWADSKPHYDPAPGGGLHITGLNVFTAAGRVKAEFGDWIVHTRGGDWRVVTAADAYRWCGCHHYAVGEDDGAEREPVRGCPIHHDQDGWDGPPAAPLAPGETPF
jgi:hypothetical protein